MINKKAVVPFLVIIIVAVVAAGGGGYLIYNNSKDTNVTKVSTETDNNSKTTTEIVVENVNTPNANLPLSEWCVKGQKYSVAQNGSTSDTVIEGIASYKGTQWCKGTSKTVIKIPGGYAADIEAITTYYFNEGAKEVWVISNVNGQTSEVHVVNK